MTLITTLPLRVEPVAGESLDSWLEALARRHHTSPGQLLTALGIRGNRRIRRLLDPADTNLLRHLEHLTRLPADRLDTTVAVIVHGLESSAATGSRFCPRCLATGNGRWQLSWRRRWSIACPEHRILLGDYCPACGTRPRQHLAGGPLAVSASTCTRPLTRSHAHRCGADLTTVETGPTTTEILAAQRWVDELIDPAGSAAPAGQRPTATDLDYIITWLLRMDPTQALRTAARFNPHRRDSAPDADIAAAPDAALMAVALIGAHRVLGDDEAAATAHLRAVLSNYDGRQRIPPPKGPGGQWSRTSSRFTGRYLRVLDLKLITSDRLRMRTLTPFAARPDADPATRARMVPQQLWPDWTARLLPASGFHSGWLRATLAALLLVPGARQRDMGSVAAVINSRVKRANMTTTLQGFDRLADPAALEQILILLCRIAEHLDRDGTPIDYQRRRELFTSEIIDWPTWRDLACSVDAHPGDNRPGRRSRLLLARRHLHQLITGADLDNPDHPMSFHNPADRNQFIAFATSMTPPLRRALSEHAHTLIQEAGLDEPLLWSPPSELADGLTLPGIEIDTLDIDTISRIVVDEQRPVTEAAELLGVHAEHIRLALERLDRPARQWSHRATPAYWRREQQAAALFTRDYFQREYLDKRRSLNELAADTGFGRHVLARYAKQAGITLRTGKAARPIDADWLRTQYLDRIRSTADIAAELGVTQMTINKALPRHGIPVRPPGVHSRPEMITRLAPQVPATIRSAVEGTLHGWQRLHRYRIAMAFPTLKTASEYLAMPSGALVHQIDQLEKAIGAPLFHRSAGRKPQQPTTLGHQLLRDLQHPVVAELAAEALEHHAPALPDDATLTAAHHQVNTPKPRPPRPMPDRAVIAQARRKAATPRKHSPLRPFDDIAVTRQRMTRTFRTVITELRAQRFERFYGLELHQRTGIGLGTLYPLLKQMHTGGWLTSHPEPEDEWLAGAPAGCGPGRRRTYYQLTPDGLRAAAHELDHPRGKRKTNETQPPQNQRDKP
ncbi:TniQ family protein [Nocardia sp. X0981]